MGSTLTTILTLWLCVSALLVITFPDSTISDTDFYEKWIEIKNETIGNETITTIKLKEEVNETIPRETGGILGAVGWVTSTIAFVWDAIIFIGKIMTAPISILSSVGAPTEITLILGGIFCSMIVMAIWDFFRSGR